VSLSRAVLVLLLAMPLCSSWGAVDAARHAPSVQAAHLLRLHMASPAVGWAMGTTGVLRTTDGGVHWRVVTPRALGRPLRRSPYALFTAFLDVARAWVAVDNAVVSRVGGTSKARSTLRLFRTDDGGHHWQALPLLHVGTFYQAGAPQFVTPQPGWLEIVRSVGAGSLWFDLYCTHDGGAHWRRVLRLGSPHSSPGAPLGCDICDADLTFNRPTTGWLTGCWCGVGNGGSFLYVSRNAGRTWRALPLAPPPHDGRSTIATLPPVLFDRRHGILPTVVFDLPSGRGKGLFDAYVTHDGGRRWTSTTPVPVSGLEGGPTIPYSFPDARYGFFVIGKRLYRTRDGGRHWQAIPESVPLEHSETMQFLDGHHGFALQAGDTQGARSILWRTADGGETWKIVPATVGTYRASIRGSSRGSVTFRTYQARANAMLSSEMTCRHSVITRSPRPHCR